MLVSEINVTGALLQEQAALAVELQWATLRRLSAVSYIVAKLPTETLLALASKEPLTTNDDALKQALLESRTILGPFTADMMEPAAAWLDQGARKVLVNAASCEDADLQRVATAVSELPANRVVLRLAVKTDAVTTDEAMGLLQQQMGALKDIIGGVVLAVALPASESAYEQVAAGLRHLRKGFEEGFLFAVEWVRDAASASVPHAQSFTRIAEMHRIGIHVVSSAAPRLVSEASSSSSSLSSSSGDLVDAGLAFVKCLRTDRPDGLFTTVVVDEAGVALGLVYSSEESILAAIESGRGVYYSRSRGGLWKKGESSGNFQELVQLDVDCDSDALRFMVRQTGAGFCHLNTRTCWGEAGGLAHLQAVLQTRLEDAPAGSYTKRLFNDPELLRNKLVEEAQELAEAETRSDVAGEAADVMYFAMVRCVAAGVTLADVENKLDARALKVKRRPGNSKAYRIAAANEILKKQDA